ncbi:MAG TPA: peptidyl-prolyl cis-trans isomerase [Tepidisphaeraceae bacterium]|nr:peptidyl-prolyl cis-trans isomerase [Tepidisphaeraceae bacterium]
MLGIFVAGACAFIVGCGEQAPPSSTPTQALAIAPKTVAAAPVNTADERIVARVKGQPITMQQFVTPLIKAHGLPLLLNMVQLELAREDAREAHVTITPQDVEHEQDLTLAKMFSDSDKKEQDQAEEADRKGQTELARKTREQIRKDRQSLLSQYLDNQHYSRVEYDIVVELNAYLRNAAERTLKGKISDDMVKQEFGVEYGQNAKVRMIVLGNMTEVEKAQQLLKLGQDFADVAKRMSRDQRTAPLGGEMPPFSRQTPGLPDEFKQLAFSLQPGQVSDPLNYGGNFYLIKLEELIAPRAVKFDSVKDALRKTMYERLTESVMGQLRTSLGNEAMQTLQINDPEMARQFNDLKAKREAAIRDRGQINAQWKKERSAAMHPATQP